MCRGPTSEGGAPSARWGGGESRQRCSSRVEEQVSCCCRGVGTCPQEPVPGHVRALTVTRGRAESPATPSAPAALAAPALRHPPLELAPAAEHRKMGWGETAGKEDGGNGLIFPYRGRSWLDLLSVPYGGSYPEDLLHYTTTLSCEPRWKQTTMEYTYSVSWKGDPVNTVTWQNIIFLSSCNVISYPLPIRLWKLAYLFLESCTANCMSVR